MAAHDFASQKKTTKAKSRPTKSRPAKPAAKSSKATAKPESAKPKKKIPAIVWIIVGISIAYGGQQGYLYLKSSPSVSEALTKANETIAATSEKIIEPVQELKEEAPRFEFYEILKSNKVEVDTTTDPGKPIKKYSYTVQAGSFRNKDDAEQMRSQLILSNLTNTSTDTITTANGTWHRVNVGPFTNRSKLEKARDKLASLNIQGLVRKTEIKK